MLIYAAIDLYEGQAVRLYKGDYAQKTVYSRDPVSVALDFKKQGITHIHLVDLEGAKTGNTPNFSLVCAIKKATGLFCEIGGGIRSMEVVDRYLGSGLDRVILGTAAVQDPEFLRSAVKKYGAGIAVGCDLKEGKVAVKGWTEAGNWEGLDFCRQMEAFGVQTLICTDIAKDGAMQGTNRELYRLLSQELKVQLIASGGVSTLEDIRSLRAYNLYGAIVGKAYYTGAIKLIEAVEAAR